MDIEKQYGIYKLHEQYNSHVFENGIKCSCGLFASKEMMKEILDQKEPDIEIKKEDVIINFAKYCKIQSIFVVDTEKFKRYKKKGEIYVNIFLFHKLFGSTLKFEKMCEKIGFSELRRFLLRVLDEKFILSTKLICKILSKR